MSGRKSNHDLLTSTKRTKKGKNKNLVISFDEKSRLEYLTGFQKRNQEKKKKYEEKLKERARKEKSEKRREKRQRIRKAITDLVHEETELAASPQPITVAEDKYVEDKTTTTVLIESME